HVPLDGGQDGVGTPLVEAGVDDVLDVVQLGHFRGSVDGEVEDVVLDGGVDAIGGSGRVGNVERAAEVRKSVAVGGQRDGGAVRGEREGDGVGGGSAQVGEGVAAHHRRADTVDPQPEAGHVVVRHDVRVDREIGRGIAVDEPRPGAEFDVVGRDDGRGGGDQQLDAGLGDDLVRRRAQFADGRGEQHGGPAVAGGGDDVAVECEGVGERSGT